MHGCADELDLMLARVKPTTTVFVGDLFTKGPDPGGVFALVEHHLAVLGNHDQRLLEVLSRERPRDEHGRAVVKRLDAASLHWRDWLRARPLFLEVAGWTVVHAGLHPNGRLEDTTKKMALVMRRYPMRNPKAPFWWQQYTGDRKVVYGHDALRGLVRVERDGQPQIIGLDTGCVYGGTLSGYVIENDEIVQVKAARRYWTAT
ncbi:MAG: metallophosphoesterase [Alphaproteobacteria bacterium]|nr:metallophosphoesterase [Alphaproteobacteria bacterium]